MNQPWQFLRTGPGEPSWNMALDEALLEAVGSIGTPVLRLYGWSAPAATFGYSQRFAEVASWTPLRPLIRRPTGGGLVPHDADWTYSLVFPPEHPWYKLRAEESYRQVHDWISDSFRSLRVPAELSECCDKPVLGRCFIGSEKFDILAAGKKIAGAAQKRNKLGLLIQGSIQPPNAPVLHRAAWEESLLRLAVSRFTLEWVNMNLPDGVVLRASELNREKYASDTYNLRR
jgi:lipoate-protein ligase A